MHENEITKVIVDVAYRIHKQVGPGLLESVYEAILKYELAKRGLKVESQLPIPMVWESLSIDVAYRLDLIVERKVVIEVKSLDEIAKVHKKQLLTYLKLTDCRVGLVINFGALLIKDGIARVVNGLDE